MGVNFLEGTIIAKEIIPGTDQWGYMALKIIDAAKETIPRIQRQSAEWEIISQLHITWEINVYHVQRSIKLNSNP